MSWFHFYSSSMRLAVIRGVIVTFGHRPEWFGNTSERRALGSLVGELLTRQWGAIFQKTVMFAVMNLRCPWKWGHFWLDNDYLLISLKDLFSMDLRKLTKSAFVVVGRWNWISDASKIPIGFLYLTDINENEIYPQLLKCILPVNQMKHPDSTFPSCIHFVQRTHKNQFVNIWHALKYFHLEYKFLQFVIYNIHGRVVVEAVFRQFLTAEVRVRAQVSPCGLVVDKVALEHGPTIYSISP